MALAACSSPPEGDPRYRPAENMLEVITVLRSHVPDDTYRFEPARDFTGRNVYRASLLRIENLEVAYESAYRSGYLDDVIGFAKGRALERLGAFDLAAQHYLEAADAGDALRLDALRSAAICQTLSEATQLEPAPDAAATEEPSVSLARLDRRKALLEAILPDVERSHYLAVVREEIEQGDVARARLLTDLRSVQPEGDVTAVAAWQQVILQHRSSKNANRHLLELADLYSDLAERYVDQHPPEGLNFDPPTFEELTESATRLYEAVANQDGATERVEAARRLEAFLAFTLRIDRDRVSR
ncbi:MAG: hypothetical protein ACR2PQ_08520 [Myxococcota bacterium]